MATIPFNVGAANQGNMSQPNKNAARETALKVFTNEIITTFEERNIFLPLIKLSHIAGAVSKQFIIQGRAKAEDVQIFKAGDKINLAKIANDEVIISISDRILYNHADDTFENLLSQWDEVSYTKEKAVNVLAATIDRTIAGMLCDAPTCAAHSLKYANVDMLEPKVFTATGYTAATTKTDKGDTLVDAAFDVKSYREENDFIGVPSVVCPPKVYGQIVKSSLAVNADVTNGNGGIDTGSFNQIAGLSFSMSNHLTAQVNGKDLLALIFDKEAMGAVQAFDIETETGYSIERQANIVVTKVAMGYGLLDTGRIGYIVAD